MTRLLRQNWIYPAALPAFSLSLAAIAVSCGSPDSAQQEVSDVTQVKGVGGFASQCPYGTLEPPVAVKLSLYNCPIGLNQVELEQPLEPLVIQADCKKKQITIRRPDRVMEATWNMMPDGAWSATVDGGLVHLKSDGPNHGSCSAPLAVDLSGKINCNDRDRVDIPIEAVWWIGKTVDGQPSPSPSPSATPSVSPTLSPRPSPVVTLTPTPTPSSHFPWPWHAYAASDPTATEPNSTCHVPSSCYFYTATTVKQCQ